MNRDMRLLDDSRGVGRLMEPDLAAAMLAVRARGADLRRRRVRWRGGLTAMTLAVVGLAWVTPALAQKMASSPSRNSNPGTSQALQAPRPPVQVVALQPAERVSAVGGARSTGARPSGSNSRTTVPTCSPAALSLETTLDRDTYAVGQPVTAGLVLANRGVSACGVSIDPCLSGISVSDSNGATVYASGADASWACGASTAASSLAPGESITFSFTWRQQVCHDPAVGCFPSTAAPGRYLLTGSLAIDADQGAGLPRQLVPFPRHVLVAGGIAS